MFNHLRRRLNSKILNLPRYFFTTQIPIQEIKYIKPISMSLEEERKFYDLEFEKILKNKELK